MINFSLRSMALVLVAGFLASCSEESATKAPVVRQVKALKISDASALQRRWFPGRAKATDEVDLSFRVDGKLVELPVNVGDKSSAGAAVAKLDPAPYQAAVDRHEAELARAKAKHENAKLQLNRQNKLLEGGWVAQAAVDRYVTLEKAAAADVNASKAALDEVELDLSYTTLQAPFAGIIVSKYVDNFQDVRAKQAIARLVNPEKIEMVVNVPENMISLTSRAKIIVVVFDAFPDVKVPAEIKEVGGEASKTTRTFPVTLIMDQPDGAQIMPGMAGKASAQRVVALSKTGHSIIVPPVALLATEDGSSAVWVIDDGSMTVSRRTVKTGTLDVKGVEVTEGLEPGEWVVTAGVNFLKPGQKVSISQD